MLPTLKFIKVNDFQGTSKTSGQPFHLRKILLADPNTFENHKFDYAADCQFNGVKAGDEVQLVMIPVAPRYGNADSTILVTEVLPVK